MKKAIKVLITVLMVTVIPAAAGVGAFLVEGNVMHSALAVIIVVVGVWCGIIFWSPSVMMVAALCQRCRKGGGEE